MHKISNIKNKENFHDAKGVRGLSLSHERHKGVWSFVDIYQNKNNIKNKARVII